MSLLEPYAFIMLVAYAVADDLLVAAVLVPALLMPVAAAVFMLGAVLFEAVISLPFKSGAAR
jgi:hypothetical protein